MKKISFDMNWRAWFERDIEREERLSHPRRDWYRILMGSTALLLLLIGISGVLFYMTQNGALGSRENNSLASPETLNQTELARIVEDIEQRVADFDAVERNPTSVPNPAR